MVLCYASTPRKLATKVACFLSGGVLFGYGLHLSYVNVAPQQARLKVRNDFVRDFLKKKYGYEPGTELGNNYKKVGPINKINYVDIVKKEISKSWLAKYWNKW
ncbi:hypothetical protein LIER_37636 [Lithospermum erythrorhizon]|uniref:Uncharacterized protein n=1 Tax=Lithospermum erythrorhizon TaxID=34254 RepID=A0AAV3PTG8_LITER